MTKRRSTDKFVGTTNECFLHLFEGKSNKERIALHKLIAGFCDINQESVSRWQRGRQTIQGMNLLRLRCFLYLAGYEVKEVDGNNEPVRSLLLIVGLGIGDDDPYEIERRLGYEGGSNDLGSLYRIILHGGNYSPEVETNINEICKELKGALEKTVKDKRAEIRQALEDLNKPKKIVISVPVPPKPVDPMMVEAFVGSARLTLTLGKLLEDNPQAIQAVRRSTRGGMDLHELKALLDALLE